MFQCNISIFIVLALLAVGAELIQMHWHMYACSLPGIILFCVFHTQNWTVASRASIGGGNWTYFSAVCWYFGRDLYDRLEKKVPIGLIRLVQVEYKVVKCFS